MSPVLRPPKKVFVLSVLKGLAPISEKDSLMAHLQADSVLLDYINDADIREAYEGVLRFYGPEENP